MNNHLQLKYNSAFADSFKLYDDDDVVAQVYQPFRGEWGRIVINGVVYQARRDGWVSRTFVLCQGDEIICRAKKSVLEKKFEIQHQAIQCTLKTDLGHTGFDISLNKRDVGTIERKHWFTRNATVKLPAGFSMELKVFVVWLAHILQHRRLR
ncbi:MAG: hypothetical protein AAF485_25515 [Chloroflexota bacterium]